MYYIPSYQTTKKGEIDINKRSLVNEEGQLIIRFLHLTEKGYLSSKPLIVHFDFTINEDNELVISDETAALLIDKYKGIEYKTFETAASRARGNWMTGALAWSSVMGDHGDTSGQFSR